MLCRCRAKEDVASIVVVGRVPSIERVENEGYDGDVLAVLVVLDLGAQLEMCEGCTVEYRGDRVDYCDVD